MFDDGAERLKIANMSEHGSMLEATRAVVREFRAQLMANHRYNGSKLAYRRIQGKAK